MNLSTQRKLSAKILKCGESRVWMSPDAGEKIKQAITRRDVRGLIKDGLVRRLPEKKSNRFGPKSRMIQAAKGRRSGHGSRKGATGARARKKEKWLKIIRPQRSLLKSLKNEGKLLKGGMGTAGFHYGMLYKQIKGGMFRSKHHLMSHLEEHKLANVKLSEFEAAEKARKAESKKRMKEALKKRYEKISAAARSNMNIHGRKTESPKKIEKK
jgi:large subunit ribosomal protein L19e